jgi:hypothetical protein
VEILVDTRRFRGPKTKSIYVTVEHEGIVEQFVFIVTGVSVELQ